MLARRPLPVLCSLDPQRDRYLRGVLEIVLDTFEKTDLVREATLVLTGSLARGEASVLQDENGFRSLSDMEFLVTFENSRLAERLSPGIAELEDFVNNRVASEGLDCKVELTHALERFFATARPSIFSRELKLNGKVVYGGNNPLEKMREYSASDIPLIDAFYLLCNRIVEQLEALGTYCSRPVPEYVSAFRYTILKTYVDIATSILAFMGHHLPSYGERRDALMTRDWTDLKAIPGKGRLLERIDYWTDVKLSPAVGVLRYEQGESPFDEWRELAELVMSVWIWESGQLIGHPGETVGRLADRLRRFGVARDMLRGQAKYLIACMKHREIGLKAPLRYLVGNPRHILYAEAITLYGRIAGQIGTKEEGKFFPNGMQEALSPFLKPIDDLVRIWTDCFRNT